MNRALLFAFAPIALGILGLACNGRVVSDDTGSLASKAKTGDAQNDPTPSTSSSSSPTTKPAKKPPQADCNYEYQSSSGGGDGSGSYFCESTDHFSCDSAAVVDQEISCKCDSQNGTWNKGSCSCTATGAVFEFDCNNGCSPGAAEYAKCNLPAPPVDTGGGGTSSGSSSSSGSSGSSGSSSSSSGG